MSARRRAARRTWRRFAHDRGAMLSLAFLVLVALTAVLAPLLAPYDPNAMDLSNTLEGPGPAHLLGTDNLGRDELSRLIFASRVSMVAVIVATGVAAGVGVAVGLVAGYIGGSLDRVIMRVNDGLFALPSMVLVLLAVAILGSGLIPTMAALGLVFASGFVRITRNAVLEVREELYVSAAQVVGLSERTIIRRHVLPNVKGPILVQATMQAGAVLLVEASLSFIGLGAQPPQVSWGTMLSSATRYLETAPWLAIFPGVAITLTVLCLNVVGNGLLDAMRRGELPVAHRRAAAGKRAGAAAAPAPARITAPASAGVAPLLAVEDLSVELFTADGDGVQVTSEVSFEIERGEIVGLVGESGCGKSTIALALLGLLPEPNRILSGSVRLEGRELLGLPQRALSHIRGAEIAMVFQDPSQSLNPAMKIGHQIAGPLRRHLGLSRGVARARAIELLERVGVPDAGRRAALYPHQLSGGMAQRAMIAIAIAGEPKLLVADEPISALDMQVREQILDLLLDLRDEREMAVLLITHDLGVVADACDRTIVAYAGELVEQAEVREVFASPRHPYTYGLLGARPQTLQRSGSLTGIPGNVPPPGAWPTGCRFNPRCAFVTSACRREPVSMSVVAPRHDARCLRAEEAPWSAA